MKAVSFLTALLVAVGAFAANQTPGQGQTAPTDGKTLIFCDYSESEEFSLFIDMYTVFNAEKNTYTQPEFGVFKGNEQIGYPDYLWNFTESLTQNDGTRHFTLSKDQQNSLEFDLTATADGIVLQKDNKGAIMDFNLTVKGILSEGKTIDATFYCYDSATAKTGLLTR